MFRIIFGLTLSTICGLFICVAFISFAADNIDQSQLGRMILGSLVLNGVPGWLLCYSGGQSLKSKQVLKASLMMLKDDNSIDIEKISSLTDRNKSKTIKDIKRGQKKGIIPNDIEIIVSPKIVEDKYFRQNYIPLNNSNNTNINFEEIKIKAKQSFKENIQDKNKLAVQLFSNILTTLIIFTCQMFIDFIHGIYLDFLGFIAYIALSIVSGIILTILNLLDKPFLILSFLPTNRFTQYILTFFYMLLIFPGILFILPFVLINVFINKIIIDCFTGDRDFSFNEIVCIFKQTSQELVSKALGKQ